MKNYNCYIHIPFCSSKCKYCRFASFWITQKLQIQNYVNFLLNEINSWKKHWNILDTIYFWWWTPWVLSISNFEEILTTLKNNYIFSNDIEISIETTPENVTIENLSWWKKLWINRISMWVQTLNEKSLKEIDRAGKWDILKALDNIKIEWFDNVSIDFIIWLPYVSNWEINENIDSLLNKYSFIKHVSVYMLEEYYDVPEDKESKFDNITYPDSWHKTWISLDDYSKEYMSIKNNLEKYNFNRYEISNYSKKWYECKHNQWYWSHKEVIAYWLWAYWYLDNIRYSNSESFLDYYSWKNISTTIVNKNDIFIEKIMFMIRTNWIDISYLDKLDKEKIDYFVENWYLKKESNKIILSDSWIVYMDYILWEIL